MCFSPSNTALDLASKQTHFSSDIYFSFTSYYLSSSLEKQRDALNLRTRTRTRTRRRTVDAVERTPVLP